MKKIVKKFSAVLLLFPFLTVSAEATIWQNRQPIPTARWGAAYGVYGSTIHVAGGSNADETICYEVLECYSVDTDSWTTGSPMPLPKRTAMGSAVVGDKLYCLGGFQNPGAVYLSSVAVYDINNKIWLSSNPYTNEPWRNLPERVERRCAVAVGTNTVYII